MIKLLHTADVHLDSPLRSLALRDPDLMGRLRTATRRAFSRIVDVALSDGVSAVLIAGDLFDGSERSARTAAFLSGQLERLQAQGVRVFYVKGNHDAENPITGEISLPDNVHVFDGRGGKVQLDDEVWIHGVSFSGRHAEESLLPKFPDPVPDSINIGMLHTSLSGSEGHDPYAPCSVADLKAHGFDYWALGHVHRRRVHSKDPWIVMPGTPQGRNIGEEGPKSATMITIDGRIEVEEVPTSVLEFLEIDIPISDAAGYDDLRDLARKAIHKEAEVLTSEFGAARVTLTGESDLRWRILRDRDFWVESIADIARETDRIWLDRLDLGLPASPSTIRTATDELSGIMEEILREPAFAEASRSKLEDILKEIPQQRRQNLAPDEEALAALARSLSESGAGRVLAQMKGGTE